MCDVCHLPGLSFSTIGQAPDLPMLLVANGIARTPEFRSDTRVGGVLEQLPQLAFSNLIGKLSAKLEIQPLVVYAPALVHRHVDAIVSVSDQVVEPPGSRLQVDVGHADERDAVPAVGTHGAIAAQPQQSGCLA